uniref:Uncharacterized protein n=1 Tax=Siphoviridae sp. ctqw35 TaxID=2826471 RepID=A0A8S5LZM5_9CAUD|nr:MAG TPA: hypothetical protein [Siphoviridae sp. ctqw35]
MIYNTKNKVLSRIKKFYTILRCKAPRTKSKIKRRNYA